MTIRFVRRSKPFLYRLSRYPQGTVLWLMGIAACLVAIAVGGLINLGQFSPCWWDLHHWQQDIAPWFQAPSAWAGWLLAGILLVITQVIMTISPQPRVWSRLLIIALLLALTVRYVLWRSLTTINLSTPLNATFSLALLVMELVVMAGYAVQLFLAVRERDRQQEADRYAVAVTSGEFVPAVDVLIPTYNEPAIVLRRTIVGCQALDYPNKQVYLLDDGDRADIRELAAELGCHYIARPDHRHAKAGNLNYALTQTRSELIAVFDADFIPTRNFLTRTIGFFQNRQIGLLQTHQCFYNADPIARNLGLEAELTHEVEVFSRHYQLIRDGANSSLCYGSSFVVRRAALRAAGGFVADTLSEDYFTGVRISAKGYQVIYLDENLSAGLVAEDMPSHVGQRQRWARGTLQAFFIKANPATLPGLSLRQRIAHLEGICQWFNSLCRVGFLILPIVAIGLGITPAIAPMSDWLYFFLPFYLLQFSTFAWLNHRSRSALISDLYAVIQCFPLTITILQTLIRPFSQGFWVTPKGTTSTRVTFHWQLALPLMVLWVLTLSCAAWTSYIITVRPDWAVNQDSLQYLKLGFVWQVYNLVILSLAILSFIDLPTLNCYHWIAQRRRVQVELADGAIVGVTTRLAEIGAEIALPQSTQGKILPGVGTALTLQIPDAGLSLKAVVTGIWGDRHQRFVAVGFEPLPSDQHRRLLETLYCTPGQWQRQAAPGELRLLWLLCRSLFYSPVLFKSRASN